NVQLSGAAIDFWALDPVALFFGSVGVSSQAPHPKAALLGANFMLSREAEQFLTKRGHMPTRQDVPVNPAYVSERLKDRKIIATIFAGDEQKKWQGLFKDIFKPKELRASTNRASLVGAHPGECHEAMPGRRRPLGGGARREGARPHRGADPDQGGRPLRDEGRCGDRGLAGVALAARGDGGEGAGQAGFAGPPALAGGAAFQARGGAHQLQGAYRRDGGTRSGAERQAVAGHRHGGGFPQSELVASRPVRGRGDPLPRAPQRARGRARDHLRQARQRYPAREGARLRDRIHHRPRHDRARSRRPQLSQIDRHLFRARAMAGHRRRDSRSGQRAAQDFRQRGTQAEQQYQAVDLRLPQADRMGLDLLHLLSRRRALYRNARRRKPGQAGRHHARAHRPDRRDVRLGPRPPAGRVSLASTGSCATAQWSRGEFALTHGPLRAERGEFPMLQVKRIGHATLTTPDLERQLDYYTRVVGLSTVAKEKGRAILATKPGQEAIVLEHGERPAGVRLAFQVAPGSDLAELSARLSKAGIKSERRSGITPGIAQAIVFTDPKGTSVEIFSDYTFAKDDDNYTG